MGSRDDIYVKQGVQFRSADETWSYTIDCSNWTTAALSSPVGTLFDVTEGKSDVSTSNLSGTATVAGTNFTTETFTGLTATHKYQYEGKFTANSQVYEFRIPITVIY